MDLEVFRTHLLVRHDRARLVKERFDAFLSQSAPDDPATVASVHCDSGHGGHHPVLAKVFVAAEGLLFSSRIKWRPHDRDSTSWMIDSMMAQAVDGIDIHDDAALTQFAALIAGLRRGPGETEDRGWLRSLPAVHIHDVLDLPPDDRDGWLPDLWMRCPDHPAAARKLDRRELVKAAVGPTSTPRHSPSVTVDGRQT